MVIRLATSADLDDLDAALRALSRALGDRHRMDALQLGQLLFGPCPAAAAVLARAEGVSPAGAALFSPVVSTSRGMAGAWISDLWVADGLRGRGLGVALLRAIRDEAARSWGAGFLRLGVYARTQRARAFYDRLGFAAAPGEVQLTLEGAAFAALGDAG